MIGARHLQTLVNSSSGIGIQGDFSLAFRIICFCTLPLMLVVSGIFGKDTGKISNKYGLIVTPPGAFFAIWGIIYIGLLVVGIYFLVENIWTIQALALFGIGCILNGLWVYIFSYGTLFSNNLCTFVVFCMLILNEILWKELELPAGSIVTQSVTTWAIVNRNIIGFYQGWLVAATNLNLGMTLVYSLQVKKPTQAYIFWIVGPLFILGFTLYNCLSEDAGALNSIGMFVSATYALVGAFISTQKGEKVENTNDTVIQ